MESTNIYWMPLFTALETVKFEVILVNAHQVKQIPGRKTDQSDSEWRAQLLCANLIKPRYVPEKSIRELRNLIRLRIKYVQTRTQCKNRVQKIFNCDNIRLRTVLSDIFGKAGTELIDGLLSGKNIGTILKDIKNKKLMAKSAELEDVVQGTLSENDHFMLEQIMRTLKDLNEQILQMEQRIAVLVNKDSLNVICSVPGIGLISGATILAELGDVGRFNNEVLSFNRLTFFGLS
jgi:transposase